MLHTEQNHVALQWDPRKHISCLKKTGRRAWKPRSKKAMMNSACTCSKACCRTKNPWAPHAQQYMIMRDIQRNWAHNYSFENQALHKQQMLISTRVCRSSTLLMLQSGEHSWQTSCFSSLCHDLMCNPKMSTKTPFCTLMEWRKSLGRRRLLKQRFLFMDLLASLNNNIFHFHIIFWLLQKETAVAWHYKTVAAFEEEG